MIIHGKFEEEIHQVKDHSIDLVLTDPPYQQTSCHWDEIIPFDVMWTELKRVIKPTTPVLLFGIEPFSSKLRLSNLKWYKYDWFWIKNIGTGFLSANKRPLNNCEKISVFYEKQPKYYPQMLQGEPYKCKQGGAGLSVTDDKKILDGGWVTENNGERYPVTTIHCNVERGEHPTQKPVDLLKYFIKTYTDKGDNVLDFTSGSGSTGVACKSLDRDYTLIEKEKEYYDIGCRRLSNVQGELFL